MAVQAKDTGDKTRAVENTVAQIEKMYGKGSIMRLGDRTPVMDIPVLSTGSIALDAALGVGGVPCGRIIEVFGPESSGKTTLAYHIVANAQKDGGTAAFIDAEHSVDPEYAKNVGVDVDSLLLSQPDSGEQALEITEMLVRSGALAVVVVDSVAALVPKAELEGEMGDSHMGLQARLMSQAMRKLTGVVSKTGTCLVFINQIRQKIGVMFGSPETTTGGRALKFYTSVRLDIRRIGAIKEGDKFIGNRTKVKVVKNKVSSPFRVAEFDILYGEGISREGDLIELGVEHKIIDKSGSWFSYGDLRIGQGRENARLFLRENTDVAATIEKLLREKLGLSRPAAEKSADSTSTAADTAAAPPKAAVQDKAARASDQASLVAPARGRGRVRVDA
ncbi:MAG: recombinase RecA [Acidobacteria bacterium]|nr:recombinase RecA [Acidobacteriota bacterium]